MRESENLRVIKSTYQQNPSGRDAVFWQRRFSPALRTGAGLLSERSGWILRETREGGVFFGEVSPFPGLNELPLGWEEKIREWKVSGDRSALGEEGALGFASWCLQQSIPFRFQVQSAGLLQGNSLLPEKFDANSTWKVKIGMEDEQREREKLEVLLRRAEPGVRFRMDANQKLDVNGTARWLNWMQGRPMVEFLEQPLPVGQEGFLMKEFGEDSVRLALDESVRDARSLKQFMEMGWAGIFVVKPSLFGNLDALYSLKEDFCPRIVVSSAFESGVGYAFVAKVASDLGSSQFAHGLGTRGCFQPDDLDGWTAGLPEVGEVTVGLLDSVYDNAIGR